MLTTILVPLDGSALASQVLPYAADLAWAARGRVLLLQVVSASAHRERALAQLAAAAQQAQRDGLTVETFVEIGDPVAEILQRARRSRADLIALATHRWSELDFDAAGSVTDQVLQRASVPLLVVSPLCSRPWHIEGGVHILVPLDGSRLAEEALPPARAVAEAFGAEVLLLRVVEEPALPEPAPEQVRSVPPREVGHAVADAQVYLERVSRDVWATGMAVRARVQVGDPATTIATVASEEHTDLIAIATHGRGGLARFLFGSVATRTVQRANVPVLLVHPTALRHTPFGAARFVAP